MSDGEKKGGGIFGIIFLVVAIGAGIAYAVYRQKTDIPDEITEAQKDPQKTLDLYLKKAYGFVHHEPGCDFGPLERLSTTGDWEWFQANWENLHFDGFNLSTAIDPTQAAVLGKTMAMMQLIDVGVSRPGPIFNPQIGDIDAAFTVKEKINDTQPFVYADIRVKLLKEDGKWRVVGFAGARARLEKTAAKEDYIESEFRDYAANPDGTQGELLPGAKPPPPPLAAPAKPGAKPAVALPAGPGPAKSGMSAAAQPAAPAGGTGITKIADDTLKKAADAWAAGNYPLSLQQAQSALAMYQRLLPANDPKIARVESMIATAEKKIAEGPPKTAPPPPTQPAPEPAAQPAPAAEKPPASDAGSGEAKPKNPWKK